MLQRLLIVLDQLVVVFLRLFIDRESFLLVLLDDHLHQFLDHIQVDF